MLTRKAATTDFIVFVLTLPDIKAHDILHSKRACYMYDDYTTEDMLLIASHVLGFPFDVTFLCEIPFSQNKSTI